ncbi:MAG: RnfABCDGE type electron transport complex subunit B [Candidatus Omnitrophica bacterium]|jgi:Na+-translocating ferredoxin:NAD+ oxidoreductase RNF subunit RnfB|nr:RnfABCDGE type electron transport complex subunit B [Candidatus Omnitrophota bacterium]
MGILAPVIILGTIGAVFGLWLGFVEKLFAVSKDPRIERIFSLLPGSNCGACGQAGCMGLAEALSSGDAKSVTCPAVHDQERKTIAEIIGQKDIHKEKTVAVLLCGGGNKCKDNYQYYGVKDCLAADLILKGPKACAFGCIGMANCLRACPFNAISMGDDGLPRIDRGKCLSCGKCVKACPRGLIAIVPRDKNYHIRCRSKDKGADTIKVCKAGCIACGKCVTACPAGAIEIKDNVAEINYSKCVNCGKCVTACPTKAIGKEA